MKGKLTLELQTFENHSKCRTTENMAAVTAQTEQAELVCAH